MFRIQVRPVSGREHALQKRSPFQQSSSADRLDAIHFLSAILFGPHSIGIGTPILVGFISIALSGCGGLVPSQGSTDGVSGTSKRHSHSEALTKVSCGSQTVMGAGTQECSVYLDAPARSRVVVSLSSNNPALTVPSTVTISTHASSEGFSAISSNVHSPQSVTLTATAASSSTTTVIQVNPVSADLSMISCGTQSLTGPTTKACSIYLSGAATSEMPVTLRSSSSDLAVPGTVTVATGGTSAGFTATASAVKTPETVTLTASSGGVSVTYPIQLNSISASSPLPSTQHVVDLSWNAPASGESVAGYHVYRGAGGMSNFQLIDSSTETVTDYSDSTVASGETYDYEVTSVSSEGQESAPSNITTVTIP